MSQLNRHRPSKVPEKRSKMRCTCFRVIFCAIILVSFLTLSNLLSLQIDIFSTIEAPSSKQIHNAKSKNNQHSSPLLESNIPIMEYDPYPEFDRDCPPFPKSLPPGIRDVKLFYHVGMIFNWKEIVHDQLVTLEKCGLAHYASSLTITYTNGNEARLLKVLQKHQYFSKNSTNMEIRLISGPKRVPWEAESINAIHDTCHEMFPINDHDSKTVNEGATETSTTKYKKEDDVLVFYFHNKGASKYKPDWRDHMTTDWSYANSLYWRKYLEYFLLERPNLCMQILANGANTCGPQYNALMGPHYSGNFWSASCKFIVRHKKEMIRLDYTKENKFSYTEAEFWLGRGCQNEDFPDCIGLINTHSRLYRTLIFPEDYKIDNEELALLHASSVMSTFNHMNILDRVMSKFMPKILDSVMSKFMPKTSFHFS